MQLHTVTAHLPNKLKIPPMPLAKEKVATCLSVKRQPSIAAVQKFCPVKAIWQYAVSLIYLMNLLQHARQHLTQLATH